MPRKVEPGEVSARLASLGEERNSATAGNEPGRRSGPADAPGPWRLCRPCKVVKTARHYRTIQVQAGRQTITTAEPLPDDLRQALEFITRNSRSTH
jgi:hypothetical protein